MTPLPLLLQHIDELRKSYEIEVSESSNEICIVFKNYPLPTAVWNVDKTDLLILANSAYPNAKMDMFWVTPGLTLKDGKVPQSGDVIETHCGKNWQRFSWHPQSWNPVTDNLLTYLEVVNHRLHMSR